jgi:hypothetical protein
MMKKFMKITAWIAGIILVIPIAGLAWVLSQVESPDRAGVSPEEKKMGSARYACTEFLTDALKDPSSAEWGMRSGNWHSTWPASVEGDVVTVHPQFRAKNGFGALTINQFVCKVKVADGMVSLVSLKES